MNAPDRSPASPIIIEPIRSRRSARSVASNIPSSSELQPDRGGHSVSSRSPGNEIDLPRESNGQSTLWLKGGQTRSRAKVSRAG